jgi:hypothetical protein
MPVLGVDCDLGGRSEGDLIIGNIVQYIDQGQRAAAALGDGTEVLERSVAPEIAEPVDRSTVRWYYDGAPSRSDYRCWDLCSRLRS